MHMLFQGSSAARGSIAQAKMKAHATRTSRNSVSDCVAVSRNDLIHKNCMFLVLAIEVTVDGVSLDHTIGDVVGKSE